MVISRLQSKVFAVNQQTTKLIHVLQMQWQTILFNCVCIAALVDLRAARVNGWRIKKKIIIKREKHKYTETQLDNVHNRIKTFSIKVWNRETKITRTSNCSEVDAKHILRNLHGVRPLYSYSTLGSIPYSTALFCNINLSKKFQFSLKLIGMKVKKKKLHNDWFQNTNLIMQHTGIWNCIHVEYDAYKQNMIYTRG